MREVLVGNVSTYIASLGVGISSPQSTSLGFEVGRYPVTVRRVSSNKLIFKATVPSWVSARITEVGAYSLLQSELSGEYTTKVITDFSEEESWYGVPPTTLSFDYSSPNLGRSSLVLAPNQWYYQSVTGLDLSGYSELDNFKAFVTSSGNPTVDISFLSPSQEIMFSGVRTNNIFSFNKSSGGGTAWKDFDWGNIIRIGIKTSLSATAHAMIVEDADAFSPSYVMVGSQAVSPTLVKPIGNELEIQYEINLGVS